MIVIIPGYLIPYNCVLDYHVITKLMIIVWVVHHHFVARISDLLSIVEVTLGFLSDRDCSLMRNVLVALP